MSFELYSMAIQLTLIPQDRCFNIIIANMVDPNSHKFSCVKTLAKKLLSSSAFSLSVSVDVPSVFNKVPIDDLD